MKEATKANPPETYNEKCQNWVKIYLVLVALFVIYMYNCTQMYTTFT